MNGNSLDKDNKEDPEEEEFESPPGDDEPEISNEEFFGEAIWKESRTIVEKVHELFKREEQEDLPWQRVTVMMRPAFIYLSAFLMFKLDEPSMRMFYLWEKSGESAAWMRRLRGKHLSKMLDEHYHDQFHELATGYHWYLYRDAGRIEPEKPDDENKPDDPACRRAITLLRDALLYYMDPQLKGDFDKIKKAVEARAVIGLRMNSDWPIIEGLVNLAYKPDPPTPVYEPTTPPSDNGFDDNIPF